MRIPERFKTGETLKKDIGPKLNALVEFVKSLVPRGDSSTVLVRHTDSGCYFSVNSRGGGPGGGAETPYDGPFAVTKKDDTTVTVKEGSVIAGITKTAVPETDISISSTCVLYMELTYDGGYTAELKTAAEMPEPSEDNYTQQIAAITVTDSKISAISQIWESGDIIVLGRLT